MKLNREEWLAERQKSIGGSDAAAIVGLNSYVTPYTVWADKTGRLPPKEDNEAMRQGRDLEQYVAERFMEATGKRVRRRTDMMHNHAYHFAHANIDRAVVGERAGLECKTTSIMNLKKFKNGDFPEHYYVQCVHYLAVTGWDRWYLAVLVLNQGFYWYTIERDEDEIAALMEAEREFWDKHVIPDVPPPVDGLKPTSDALEAIFPNAAPGLPMVDLFGREEVARNYLTAKELSDSYGKEAERYRQILEQDLQQNDSGTCGNYLVTWKNQSRSTFDVRRFSEDHPDVDLSSYFNVSHFRRFKIKENE